MTQSWGTNTTLRDIERHQFKIALQEESVIKHVSFNHWAAIKYRECDLVKTEDGLTSVGLLFGTVDSRTATVHVEVVYKLGQNQEEPNSAGRIATELGLEKVGWIFISSSRDKSYSLSDEEIKCMAEMQNNLGDQSITCIGSLNEIGEVYFEAYQVSETCKRLQEMGWFVLSGTPAAQIKLQNPQRPMDTSPIVLPNGNAVGVVDPEWFLMPVSISSHRGYEFTRFPIENCSHKQSSEDLKLILQEETKIWKILDFHLLLWLSNFLILNADISLLCETVTLTKTVAPEYELIIRSLAGI